MTERTEHALPELAMVLEQEPNYPWRTKIVPASLSFPECIAHLPVGTVLCSRAAAVKRIAEVERERDEADRLNEAQAITALEAIRDKARAERERDALKAALHLLACLHPCLTVDDERPIVMAETILDQVQAERMELAKQIASAGDSIRILHGMLHKMKPKHG